MIGWEEPQPGQVKLNTNGAVKGNRGLARAGGFIKDDSGIWLCGFTHNIGISMLLGGELWGMKSGIELGWDLGYRQIMVEVDSEVVSKAPCSLVVDMGWLAGFTGFFWIFIGFWIETSRLRSHSLSLSVGSTCADWLAKAPIHRS